MSQAKPGGCGYAQTGTHEEDARRVVAQQEALELHPRRLSGPKPSSLEHDASEHKEPFQPVRMNKRCSFAYGGYGCK